MCAHCSDSLYVKWSVHLYVEYKYVCRKTERKGSGLSCVQLMHLVQSEQGGRRLLPLRLRDFAIQYLFQ